MSDVLCPSKESNDGDFKLNIAKADIRQSDKLIFLDFISEGILLKTSRTTERSPFIDKCFFLFDEVDIS